MLTASPSDADVFTHLDGAVLVRHPVSTGRWHTWLPPLPAGRLVTVSVAGHDRNELRALEVAADDHFGGYRYVSAPYPQGLVPPPPRCVADLLVPGSMISGSDPWWSALQHGCERIFDLSMGPVLTVLGPILLHHLNASHLATNESRQGSPCESPRDD